MSKNTKVTEAKEQIERFKRTARELGCDEDEAAFEEKLKTIVRPSLVKKDGDQTRNRSNKSCDSGGP